MLERVSFEYVRTYTFAGVCVCVLSLATLMVRDTPIFETRLSNSVGQAFSRDRLFKITYSDKFVLVTWFANVLGLAQIWDTYRL